MSQGDRRTGGGLRRALKLAAIGVSALLVVILLHAAYLLVFVDELPAPPSSSLPDLPSSVLVVDEGQVCASGGCWRELTIRPSGGNSAIELAAQLGLDVETCEPGNLWDPRQLCIGSVVQKGLLHVYAANFSRGNTEP
jgi:hypothetical protein